MVKSKKLIQVKKAKTSIAKNISSQLGLFFISEVKNAFIKLRQAFIETLIINYIDPKHYIQIQIDISGYAIDRILS